MTADEPSLERQIGCMAGFFHLFDRNYIPSKRYVSPKTLLLTSSDTESISPSEKSNSSSTFLPAPSPNVTPSLKETPWKVLEASRLSLDSRAVTDAKGKLHRRSPGAVARLMGLDALPNQDTQPKPAMLRRSSSESRARTDPSFYQFVDATAFEKVRFTEKSRKQKNNSFIQRKSIELFPTEQKRVGVQPVPVSLYCEIERRLRIRGIEEPAKDLETLKQVLEAVQLRGLLHSKPFDVPDQSIDGYDCCTSPVVLMKSTSKPSRVPRRDLRSGKQALQSVRGTDRRVAKSEMRRGTERKLSPGGSPVGSPRKVGPGPGTVRSGVNNGRRDANMVQRGISTGTGTGSDKRIKNPPQYDWEEERTGQNILERCDQLLYSIAAITATGQISSEDLQPSPVSVLDSVFHGDECSPSPKTKRNLHFQDQPFDWARNQSTDEIASIGSECSDPDYIFVAEIMRYSDRCHDSSKLFLSLEKHHKLCGGSATLHHRRLLNDLVCEILNRHRHMSSWEAFKHAKSTCWTQYSQMPDTGIVWQQIQQMREPIIISNEVADVTSSAVSKDMATDDSWAYQSAELSEAVLQIERMIFKDVVADTIHELADVAAVSYHLPRRKLIF
ncbi:protein LONGIFOLIA 1-like protein [Carex littledalei]|uniref:Protein LONGIFOLIA 1-like protein n=1 Tax=Carex littledalei TaxID=544730 RepID=A0A833QNR7_9POAL|nr:protein LONGIFOLIA 1-like protein [Carex littledalei]